MKNLFKGSTLLLLLAVLGSTFSCKDDKKASVQAGFTYVVDANDFKTVKFTSTSTDAIELSWNFGDVSPLSTEANPSHTFPGEGQYTVSLTATDKNGKDEDIVTQIITITDPDAQLTALVGNTTKTWKLLRVVAPGRWPLEVGPIAMDQVWWGQGRDNDEIALRPCIMNDEFIFGRDGSYQYKSNGDFWAEGNVFEPANICAPSTAANLTGPMGSDLSAFGDGTHAWVIENGTKLTLNGLGAWIGLPKIGTDTEVKEPQASTTLDIIKLTDGDVDSLILESKWKFADNTSGNDDAYWRITLVHYDDPSQEPALPGPKPQPSFTTTLDGLTVNFINTSALSDSYAWDFGDGGTSTQAEPTHTYATTGVYTVTLTATNPNGSVVATQSVTIAVPMTADKLVGGAWRVRNAANSVVVGPGLGDGAWYQVSADALAGVLTGPDDWSCMTDDDFIFTGASGPEQGTMQYKTNGTARNDGYMGTPQGCWTDAEIAGSGNGAAFGSATHGYEFIPASVSPSGRPIIKLTNGPTGAAFIGFYKGFYGGENGDGANAPNGGFTTTQYEVISYLVEGGQEIMTVSVDINVDHNGSAAWTMVMVR